MSSKMKVGQVGVGGFGAVRRANMRQTQLFDLVACYDSDAAAMEDAVEEDGAEAVGSYDELLDTPELEAMVISTGDRFHADQAAAAADRGLHVFVERPLCATAAEVDRILDAADRNHVVMGCGHHDHRSEALSSQLKGMLDSGEIGQVAAFEATTCRPGGWHGKHDDGDDDLQEHADGMLLACGVDEVHELMYYFGAVARVFARMRHDINPDTPTADAAQCQLEFASGLTGTLNVYHVAPYRHTLDIFGTRTNIYRDSRFFHQGDVVNTQTTDHSGRFEPLIPLEVHGDDEPNGNLRSFHEAIRGDAPCYPSALDGARAVEVILAATASARTGACVDVRQLD